MSILQPLKCKMGIHNWSGWQYKAENNCEQERKCKQCANIANQTEHIWQWQYVSDNSCKQTGMCERCHFQSTREIHDFSEWSTEESEETSEDVGTVHGMDTTVTPWTRHRTDTTRKCRHCGCIESDTVYGEKIYGETYCQ